VAILGYAPVILPSGPIVRVGSCVLWLTLSLSCFLGAGPLVSKLGVKRAMLVGLFCFDAFYVLFAICTLMKPGVAQWGPFMLGMFLLGFGVAIMMTAISLYMANVAAILAEESPEETVDEMTHHLGGSLAVWSLGTEVFFKLATGALEEFALPSFLVIAIWTVLAVLCTFLFMLVRDTSSWSKAITTNHDASASEVRAFFRLWRDPKLWLLGFTNFTFAFVDALMSNYVNPHYVAPMLGTSAIGVVTAVASLVGAVLAKPYSLFGAYLGDSFSMLVGALSFAVVPCAILFTNIATEGGWWVLFVYVGLGSGRAITEGVYRAMFAKYFPGRLLDAAYANFTFQGAAVETACNFAQIVASKDLLLYTSLTLAAATVPMYFAADGLHKREEGLKEESPNESGDDSNTDNSSEATNHV